MYGEATYGEVAFGDVPSDIGVPIIVEVTLATAELVLVVEVDLIQPIIPAVS